MQAGYDASTGFVREQLVLVVAIALPFRSAASGPVEVADSLARNRRSPAPLAGMLGARRAS